MARLSLLAPLVLCVLALLVPTSLSQPAFSFTTQTSNGFTGRQQGGLLVVNATRTVTSITLSSNTAAAVVPGALVIFGGQNGASGINDVWYSTNGGQLLSSVAVSTTAPIQAQSYGPATCVDSTQQILYSLAGDLSGDTAGTSQVYYSLDLGQ